MANNSLSLHRVIKAAPEKVFRAFVEANAIAAWLPSYGFTCTVHEMDAKEGGSFKMSVHNFTTGNGHSFSGRYIAIKPGEFLQYTDTFDDPNLPGEMTTSITFNKVMVGTEIKIVQEGIPAMIPVEMCYLAWQESLEKLIKLVEPNIKDT
ncbi:MAG: polyketide cyclase [Chitinophagaceae bacterium]